MKSTELRIGNLVNGPTEPCVVRGTTKNGIWLNDKAGPIESNWIKPIPLTEERLIKLGATKLPTKSGFAASYKLGSLTINKSAIGNYYYRKNVYNNLHQIQNLYFAVEQEELTI